MREKEKKKDCNEWIYKIKKKKNYFLIEKYLKKKSKKLEMKEIKEYKCRKTPKEGKYVQEGVNEELNKWIR